MNRHPVKDSVQKEKGKAGADGKRKEQKGQHEKRDGSVGAVLKGINEDSTRNKK